MNDRGNLHEPIHIPKKRPTNHNTRNPQKYIEHKPRTERMKKNPITYMRHLLNNI